MNVTTEATSPYPKAPRALIAIVFLGLAMVICATVAMPWPSDLRGQVRARLVTHWERMLEFTDEASLVFAPDPTDPDLAWVWRRAWDGLHYGMVLGGVGLALLAAVRGTRGPWIGLSIIGLAGTLYAGSMALYNAPLVATPGYLLILFASLFGLLIQRQ
jgi:hypothetical protein